MTLILYELGGTDGLRYSQFSWRTRLALAHKGLEVEIRPVAVSDKASIAFSRQERVPILVDDGEVIPDSWAIAEYLERRMPDAPSLFGGEVGHGLNRFVNTYVDRTFVPAIVPMFMLDLTQCVETKDAAHLRSQIESAFRAPLEVLAAKRDEEIERVRKLMNPFRVCLRAQPFLSGQQPAYADYVLFSLFQWVRLVSAFPLIEETDQLASWQARMLDVHGGLARRERSRLERETIQ